MRAWMVFGFDRVTVVAAIVAGWALWLEHGHHIVIDVPGSTDLATLAAAAGCPDNDTLPYPASCLAFLQPDAEAAGRGRAAESPVTPR